MSIALFAALCSPLIKKILHCFLQVMQVLVHVSLSHYHVLGETENISLCCRRNNATGFNGRAGFRRH